MHHEIRAGATRRARSRLVAFVSVGAVVAVVLALVMVKTFSGSPKTSTKSQGDSLAPASVTAALEGVTQSGFDAVGAPKDLSAATALKGQPPLTVAGASGSLPGVVYVGADFCPYCAAERWPIAVALSRFGSFSGLKETWSSASDAYADTSSLSFYKSSYSSPYLSFSPVELYGNTAGSNGRYPTLDKPTSAEQRLLSTYDAPPYTSTTGGIPFLDVGNKYLLISSQYSPQVLSGLSTVQIAADLSNPQSPVAQSILGSANYLTAAICSATAEQPQSVCTDPAVVAAGKALG